MKTASIADFFVLSASQNHTDIAAVRGRFFASITGEILGILLGAALLIAVCLHLVWRFLVQRLLYTLLLNAKDSTASSSVS
jgi:cytochrome c oxidase subunit IV